MRSVVIVLMIMLFTKTNAQELRFRQYRVENGLPSDVIKAVSQDTLGFIWIATDDGLVKYDGYRFVTYKSPFQSQYIKNLFRTRNGRLLAVGDLDFLEIENQVDTVIFHHLVKGSRSPSDSTISYPKSIYEDRSGNLWLAEPQSVVCYSGPGKPIKRFDFGNRLRSPVYIRSFQFFEDDTGQFFVFSYSGFVFRYEASKNRFVQTTEKFPNKLSHVLFKDHTLWVAANEGLYRSAAGSGRLGKPERVSSLNQSSYLLNTIDSSFWVSTYGDALYRFGKNITDDPVLIRHKFNGINHLYNSYDGDLWVSTDKGIVLLQKNYFELADSFSHAHFIEGMAYDAKTRSTYYAFKEVLVERQQITSNQYQSNVLYNNKDSYFQCLQLDADGLWASTDYRVLFFQNRKLTQEFNFRDRGDFVHDIFLDHHNNLWMVQDRNPNLMMLDSSRTIRDYPIPVDAQNEINLVREGSRGIYVASSGHSKYLFLKSTDSQTFKDISLALDFTPASDLNIHDMAITGDVLWLATTEGLLRYDHESIKRVNLGETMTTFSISSIEILDEQNILFSNSFGLIRYDVESGDFWLYDESAGLPSNTITDDGILVDNEKRVWLGTSFGLAVASRPVIDNTPTSTPLCIEAQVNGTPKRFRNGLEVPYGSFVNLLFSPITFPENKIIFQWKLDHDTTWHALAGPQLSLSRLSTGTHQVSVRAKKNTGQGWSKPYSLSLTIDKPYWREATFITGVLLMAALIAYTSYAVSARMMKRRRVYLQNLVNEKTHDLQLANDELTLRNAELDRFVYSASHDLSAPLKSVLGLISVARMDKAGNQEQYLNMMERSIRKLEEFIKEVVTYSRNTRMPLKLEQIDFNTFVQNLLLDHQYAPDFHKMHFQITESANTPFVTDATRLKIILNNLISNSIKFHWPGTDRESTVHISLTENSSHHILQVADNGQGIDEKHLRHIFDMFYRAEEKAPGSGLGLYILKESVTKLGGTVEARSKIDHGTTFTIKLPKIKPIASGIKIPEVEF